MADVGESLFPPDRRAAAKARCEAAEAGPWGWGNGSDDPADDDFVWAGPPNWGADDLIEFLREDVNSDRDWAEIKADCEFVAHARLDLPDALAELDRLTAENDRLRAGLMAARGDAAGELGEGT